MPQGHLGPNAAPSQHRPAGVSEAGCACPRGLSVKLHKCNLIHRNAQIMTNGFIIAPGDWLRGSLFCGWSSPSSSSAQKMFLKPAVTAEFNISAVSDDGWTCTSAELGPGVLHTCCLWCAIGYWEPPYHLLQKRAVTETWQ